MSAYGFADFGLWTNEFRKPVMYETNVHYNTSLYIFCLNIYLNNYISWSKEIHIKTAQSGSHMAHGFSSINVQLFYMRS